MTTAASPLALLALLATLAACTKPPEPDPVPVYDPNVDVTPGWNEKEPDTCHAGDYAHLMGQPASILPSAGISREYRVIAPGSIVTQEYNSARIDISTDANGLIVRMSCG